MSIHKNWPAICALQNANTKFLFCITQDDEDIIPRLQRGWPECFSETPVELCCPVSVIFRLLGQTLVLSDNRQVATYAEPPGTIRTDWRIPLIFLRVPIAHEWNKLQDIPAVILQQMVTQMFCGSIVHLHGQPYVVVRWEYEFISRPAEKPGPSPLMILIKGLSLVAAKYINLES